jgi:hypothetical protein
MPGITKNKQKKPINFSLKGIELINFSLNNPLKPLANPIKFQFDIKLEHRLNNEMNIIIVLITVNVLNENRETNYGTITVSSIFEIFNYHEYLDKVKKTVNFPEEFVTTINSISLSTTRGVMFSQFRGTFLHFAFLPLMDVKSFQLNKKPEKSN